MLSGRSLSTLFVIGMIGAFALTSTLAQTKTNSSGTGGIHQIRGKVYLPNGMALDTPIQVELQSTSYANLNLMTDASASFVFENLAPGPYTVVVNAGDQFEPARESVLIDDEIKVPFATMARPKVLTVPIYLQLKRSARHDETGVINAKWTDISKDAVSALEKGTQAALDKQLAKAEADFKKAIEIAPTYAPAYTALGKLYLTQGKVDDAITNLHLAIHYDPSDFDARLALGVAFLNQKDFEGARRELNEAASLNKTAVMPRYYLGLVYMQKKNTDAAQKELEAAKEMIGDHVFPLLHRYLGVVYAAKQMNKQAVAELETYIKQDPKAKDTDQVKQAIADLKSKMNQVPTSSSKPANEQKFGFYSIL
jgi:Tfp pilus assembly protein PilF